MFSNFRRRLFITVLAFVLGFVGGMYAESQQPCWLGILACQ